MGKKLSTRKNAAYNSAGAIFYSICQWAITLVSVRLSSGYEETGILQLSISISNIFFTIACFLPRTYQISDTEGEFSPNEYIGIRLLTCFASVVLCFLYALFFQYRNGTLLCIMLYMIFRAGEGMSDVYRGFAQINYRMDYEFWSYLIRGITALVSFSAALVFTKNIVFSLIAMSVSGILLVAVLDVRIAKCFVSVKPKLSLASLRNTGQKCWPIVAASFLATANAALPRQFLEKMSGTSVFGYYATIATPIVFVQLLATSIFNPMLNDFTVIYKKRDIPGLKVFGKTVALDLLMITVCSLLGARLCGEEAYVLLYGEEIRQYCYLMYPVIGCAVFYSVFWILGNLLIIIRKQMLRLVITGVGTACVIALGRVMIEVFQMNGVSYCVLICYILCSLLSFFVIIRSVSGWTNKYERNGE